MTAVSFTGSIYMTLAITVERYMAVCHPHRYRELNSTMRPICRALIYTMPVATFAIVINVPKFFETKVTTFPYQQIHFDKKGGMGIACED